MDESILAVEAKNGNLEAFNRLILIYQDMAYNVAFRILSDSDAAEDATQISFISAYKHIKSYRGGSFKAWLLRIVTNNCYDELRRQKRHPTTPLEPLNDEEEVESAKWMADKNPLPETQIEESDLETAIQNCIDHLPEDFKVVVVLVELEGLDYKEVAETVRKPLGTIKSRLARARLRLQKCLQQFRELLPPKFRLDNEESL
ncbi:MAG: sigma-70 family RNA polymerase sigma factor [Anaerolineaceae bacterium]|nr:sigma-70 family RNA polymerase sigma factor [Anaerolineaceae bacterium]